MIEKAKEFYAEMNQRRSVRSFESVDVPVDILRECIKAAGTAPSGANKQPWFFAIVKDSALKKKIREAAEREEALFYGERADEQFLKDLEPFSVNWEKPHLEEAGALIVIFAKFYDLSGEGRVRNYYPLESVGIATGILITALHRLGFDTLTHTPNPMRFLNEILDRPKGERPFLILAVGHRSPAYVSPNLNRKPIEKISKTY